ncbi:MAG: glycosyltransferase [Candidatus Omnitrophota bacterium]
MKRIILFYISEFGGHSKAASNIKEALLERDPSLLLRNVNGFGYFYPRTEKFVDGMYTAVIKHVPYLWGSIYDRKPIIKNLNPLRKFVNERTFEPLSRLLQEFPADCFVATQAFPCGLVADFKKHFGIKIPLVAVVTDYHPHGFWLHPAVDKYVVACSEAKEALIREGVNEDKIEILGIPISVKFLTSQPREQVVREFGFNEQLRTVLIMGGGLGIGPIAKIAQTLDDSSCDFQTIVVCGKNKKLYEWFIDNKSRFKKPIFCFEYVDFIHRLMDVADVIVTKSGGITISEALAKGLAIIITKPIPGQEERNVNYLLSKQAVIRADEPALVGEEAKKLLEDAQNMFGLKERAKRISLANSSLRIAELIIRLAL